MISVVTRLPNVDIGSIYILFPEVFAVASMIRTRVHNTIYQCHLYGIGYRSEGIDTSAVTKLEEGCGRTYSVSSFIFVLPRLGTVLSFYWSCTDGL